MGMTAEERARDVVANLCGPRAAENWVNRDVVINHIRAAEQEAEQRGLMLAIAVLKEYLPEDLLIDVTAAIRDRARGKQTEPA